MACRASIISPISGKRVSSHVYYQLTSFFPKNEAVDIYNAMYTEGFKELLGFDWTTNTDRTKELSYSGEPNIETVAKLLNLDLTSAQIKSANQLEELATTVQSNFEFAEYNQASVVAAEINMNPRFDAVGAQVVRTENGFTVQYKPTTENREKINLSDLRGLNFGDIVDHIGQVEEFDLMQMFSALENMSELEPFQAEIISRLKELGKINPSLKLAVFDKGIGEDSSQVAFYDNATNTIYVGKAVVDNMDNNQLVRDIIHEAMHSYTIKALNEPTTPEEIAFRKEMTDAYDGYLKKFPILSSTYGFSNVEEFVSEFMSNPEFRNQLIKYQEQLKDKSFVEKIIQAIKNLLSGNFSNLPNTESIQKSIDNYLDYLMTIQDLPKTEGEYTLRFNNTSYNPLGATDIEKFPELGKLVEFVQKNLQGKTWTELKKFLKEVDSNNRSLDLLQAEFAKINATEAKDILAATINYLTIANGLLKRVQSQLSLYSNNEDQFEEHAIISAYNSAKNLALTINGQYSQFNQIINDLYTFSNIKNEDLKEQAREELGENVPGIVAVMANLESLLDETQSNINSIQNSFNNKVIRPVASVLAKSFDLKALENGKKQIKEQLDSLNAQLVGLRAKGRTRRVRATEKQIKQLETFMEFQPTEENISKILRSQDKIGEETTWVGKLFNNAVHAENPTIQLIKQLIDKTNSEAAIQSQTFTFRASQIYNKLRTLRGSVALNLDSYKNLYKGFYRIVSTTVTDQNGKKKKINQAVLNTRLLHTEFENDFNAYESAIQEAMEEGDLVKAEQKRQDLEKFLDDYAQSPYTEEFNEIQRKLIPEAKDERQRVLNEILIAQQEDPIDGDNVKELLREFNRLGSIYDINGNEKPTDSLERRIADSIMEWKKERREEDVLTYDFGPKATEWSSQKKAVEYKVSKAEARLDIISSLEAAELFNPSEIESDPRAKQLLADRQKSQEEYEQAIKERDAWYKENTRSILDDSFFKAQKKITDAVREIYAKYPNTEENNLGELYDKLFNAVLGFRDNDGVVQGLDVSRVNGLRDTLKAIELEIEAIKLKVNTDRELSLDDRKEIKRLFKELGKLQTRENTVYYEEKINEIRASKRSEVESDQVFMDSLTKKAEDILEMDIAMGNSSVFGDVEAIKEALISSEIEKRVKESEWYAQNHYTTEETRTSRDGEQVTVQKTKPLYMWTQTVPNDPRYLKTDLPSFKWAIPTIKDTFKNKDYRFTGKPSPRETTDQRYVNKEYTKLGAEEKVIMDEMIALQEDIQRSIPKGQRMGYAVVPERKTLWESTWSALRDPFSKGSFTSVYNSVIAPFLPDVSDEMDSLAPEEKESVFEGRKKQLIRTRFTTPLSESEVSYDILGNMAKYGVYSTKFDALKKIMPTVFITRDALDKNKSVDVNTLNMIDNEIAKDFYGESIGKGKNLVGDGINRAFRKVVRSGSRRVLSLNTVAAIKNLVVNMINTQLGRGIEGISRKEFNKALRKAVTKEAWIASRDISLGGSQISYYADLLMHFEANPTAIASKKAGRINQTFMERNLSMEALSFGVRGAFETISTIAIFEAIIAQYNVEIEQNGVTRTIKLSEAYEQQEGRLVLKQGVKVEDISRLEQSVRDRIFTYTTRTQGNYYERGRSFYHRNIVLEILMNMKKWMAPMIVNKYGSTRYQLNTGDVMEGYNRTLYTRAKNLAMGGGMNNISTQDKRRLTNVGTSLLAATASKLAFKYLMLFIAAQKAKCTGDDCEDEGQFAMYLAMLASGTYDELSSFNAYGIADWSYKTFAVPPVKQPGDSDLEATIKQLGWSLVSGTFSASNQALVEPLTAVWNNGLTGEFYYENSSGIRNVQGTPKLLAGSPAIFAAFAMYTGLDVAAAPYMDTERKLYNMLKYNPRLMMSESSMFATNPLGSYEKLETETSILKKSLSTLNESDRVTDPQKRKEILEQMVQNEFKMEELAKSNKYLDKVNTNKKNLTSLSQKLSRDVDKELKNFMKNNYPTEYETMKTESNADRVQRRKWRDEYLRENPIPE